MGEHDIIPAIGQGGIEDNRSNFLGVRMGEPLGALRPAIGKSGQAENRTALSYPGRVGPNALDFGGNKRRLFGQLKPDTNNVLDMLRSKVQIMLGFMQLSGEFLQLAPQIAFEFEHPPRRLSLLLSTRGIEA